MNFKIFSYTVLVNILLLGLFSCSFYPDQYRAKWKNKLRLNPTDSICLSNYVYARVYEEDYTFLPNDFEVDTANNDSIWGLFKSSLGKLNLPISHAEVQLNKFQKEIFRTNPIFKSRKVRELPKNKIIELANTYDGKINLFPIITLQTINTMDGFYKFELFIRTRLTISIYMVKDNKIIFLKSQYREFSLTKRENWDKDEAIKRTPIPLVNWDRLLNSLLSDNVPN